MSLEPDDPKLFYVPFDVAVTPPGGLIEHFKNRWWSVHPERGVIFFRSRKRDSGSAQCNGDEATARQLQARLYPWAECRFMPSVFRRIDISDYR